MGWKVGTITDYCEVKDGTHDTPAHQVEGKFLITSKNLTQNGIDFDSAYKVSIEDFNNINKRSLVENFDILYSMIGTIGNMLIVNEDKVDFCIKNMALIKTSQNQESSFFIYEYLRHSDCDSYLQTSTRGSIQKFVALDILRNIPIFILSDEIKEKFNKIITPIYEKKLKFIKENEELTKLRDYLLPLLMNGQIEVK